MSVVTCNATAVRFSILLCVAHKLIPTLVKKLLLSFESKCQKNKARRVETSRDENHSENSCPKEKGFLRFEELKLHEGRQIRSQSDSRKTLELLRQGSHRCTCTRGKKGASRRPRRCLFERVTPLAFTCAAETVGNAREIAYWSPISPVFAHKRNLLARRCGTSLSARFTRRQR